MKSELFVVISYNSVVQLIVGCAHPGLTIMPKLLPRQLLRLRVEVCWPPFPLPQVATMDAEEPIPIKETEEQLALKSLRALSLDMDPATAVASGAASGIGRAITV